MKRLRLLILIFCATLAIPLAYVILRSYQGLAREEAARLRYFAEALLDEMGIALERMVVAEESRAIDEYTYTVELSTGASGPGETISRPLSRIPGEKFLLGYFQNNPDGSFQTPLVETGSDIPEDRADVVERLKNANRIFNQKRVAATDVIRPRPAPGVARVEETRENGFADKYLDISRVQKSRSYLGQQEKRVESISRSQVMNIAGADPTALQETLRTEQKTFSDSDAETEKDGVFFRRQSEEKVREPRRKAFSDQEGLTREAHPRHPPQPRADDRNIFPVELAPLQSVFIDEDQIFVFRRIMINNQIFRQGFILLPEHFIAYLAETYFSPHPMAIFATLRLSVREGDRETSALQAGVPPGSATFRLVRTFPPPFSFLAATLTCERIPRSAGRSTLNIMLAVLVGVMLIGLFAIYKSARAVVELSERRSRFVSSVTHELKTPLTNIRLYAEMLAQGVAQDREREEAYINTLGSESARLSRLIDNVLELSKLEKKQRHIELRRGNFEDVIEAVDAVMKEKLKQEGFCFNVKTGGIRPFSYDPEVMIQILINLIENSIKFGKTGSKKEITLSITQTAPRTLIAVSDTGPGIPNHAIKKIFEDFYRPDTPLSRSTGGVGIGLALVKKFVEAMGGEVTATNKPGRGCTITLSMPS